MTNEYDKDMRARRAQKALKRRVTYEIMHMDSVVAQLSSSGDARVLLPYSCLMIFGLMKMMISILWSIIW